MQHWDPFETRISQDAVESYGDNHKTNAAVCICNGLPYPPPDCYALWLPIMLKNNGLFSFCSSLCLHSASWILGQLSQLRFPLEFVEHAFVWSTVPYMLWGIFCNMYFAFAIMYLARLHCLGNTFTLYCAATLLKFLFASWLKVQVTHQRLHTGEECLFSPMSCKCYISTIPVY